jgi:transcriptional regulator with XRE-family HTH domain
MNSAKKNHATTPDSMPELSPSARPLPRRTRTPAMTLRALRKGAAKTQADVSEVSGIAQSEVSRLEGRESLDELQLSTLRRYVEALGGKLEIVAAFESGHRMKLVGSEQPSSE